MKNEILKALRYIRSVVMRRVRTRESYMRSRNVRPISTKYGFDRGVPVDRFYIEKFIRDNKDSISGKCLEIVDDSYTVRFGGANVTESDVLDIFSREKTTILGDLRNLSGIIADNSYDCLIITQTINVIDDYESAIRECYRILKPGGTILVTLPTISPTWNLKINLWGFTLKSAKYVFEKYFDPGKTQVVAFGNRVVAECFWSGMAVEDLTKQELIQTEDTFPLIIGVKAVK